MGQCQCKKGALMERNLDTDAGKEDNLVLHDEEIKKQKASKVKSQKKDLLGGVRQLLRNIGGFLSEEEFHKKLPEDYNQYMIEHPYAGEFDVKQDDIVDIEPFQFLNGNLYWGQWNSNAEMSGEGKYYLSEAQVLVEGFWLNGICKKARIILPEGFYEGEIEDNLFNGNGKMQYKDGRVYDGEWVQGNKEGNGCLSWPDGSKYWGQFKNDQINGEGEFLWGNGCSYKGNFVNGSFNGMGTFKNGNGSSYTGDFSEGLFHGKGKFIWTGDNKERYCGEYKYGKKEGKGKYTFANGDVYDGEWFENKPHGLGQFETEGKIYKAMWRNGQIAEAPLVEVKEGGDPNEPVRDDLNFITKEEDIDYNKLLFLDNLTEAMRMNKIKGTFLKPKENLIDSMM